MRKFTKEISALLASAAVGTALCAGAAASAAESASPEPADGLAAETTCDTELVGTMMPEETTTHSFEVEIAGETLPEETVTEAGEPEYPTEAVGVIMMDPGELEPLMGDIALPDDDIVPTEELPPLAGEPLPSDEDIEDPEDFPPLAGIPLPADGDIDGSGDFGVTDALTLQRWLHGDPDIHPANLWAADLYPDGVLDVFDLGLMQQMLINRDDAS